MLVLLSVLVVWVLACAFAAVLCASALRGDRILGMRRPAADGDDAAPVAQLRAS
jgi:uncharacterized membrane protein